MSSETLSVVIPCYRQAHYLPQALSSVLDQTRTKTEVIVVDDGSPDDVPGACAPFGSRVRCVRQSNQGLAAARNTGIRSSSGYWLHFLDADDWVQPEFYNRQLAVQDAVHPGTLAVSPMTVARADGRLTKLVVELPCTGRIFPELAGGGLFAVGCVLIPRSLMETVGSFDQTLRQLEDWDLWVRVARTGATFVRVSGPGYVYRMQQSSMSHRGVEHFAQAAEVLRRIHAPDPRVARPDPAFAEGADPALLPRRLAEHAAACLGKAVASRHVADAEAMLDILTTHLAGELPWERCLNALMHELVVRLDLIDQEPNDRWPVLLHEFAVLARRTDLDSTPFRVLATIIAHAASMTALRATLAEQAANQAEHLRQQSGEAHAWRARYLRLSRAFPVRQLLWLRRWRRRRRPKTLNGE